MKFNVKRARTQNNAHARAELLDVKARPNNQVLSDHIERVSPTTFSQKLYQSHALEIAEEFEHTLGANSLKSIKKLLNKVLES